MAMNIDFFSLLVSIGSLGVAAFNYHKYKMLTTKYNDMVQVQTLTAQGALETQIRQVIMQTTHDVTAIAVQLADKPDNEMLQFAYKVAEESYRNAYEDACAKYIDNKIDQNRFEKMYKKEIRRLVEEEPHKQFYADLQTQYSSTANVYKKWFSEA